VIEPQAAPSPAPATTAPPRLAIDDTGPRL
jgi:hypothetical protein